MPFVSRGTDQKITGRFANRQPGIAEEWLEDGFFDIDLEAKQLIADIARAFNHDVSSGFTTASGIKMNCDISDVQRLKSAYDLAVLTGQAALPIVVDYDNVGHENVALADVLSMILELGVQYQTLYAKKNMLRMQAMAALTQADLDAVVW